MFNFLLSFFDVMCYVVVCENEVVGVYFTQRKALAVKASLESIVDKPVYIREKYASK